MNVVRYALGTAAGLALICAAGAAAQQPPTGPRQGGPPGPPQDPQALVFEREVFEYPRFERRNPFSALVGTGTGPRFEGMTLVGIVFVPDNPSQSMAIVRVGTGGEDASTDSRRLRSGQTWGNVRIVEVRRDEVLVEVEEFGLTEQVIMRLPTRRQGGS